MRVVAAAAVLGMLGACGWISVADGSGGRVGELVGSWSQGTSESWVDDAMPIATVLLASEDELEEWLSTHGSGAEDQVFDEVRAVDLSENVLVIGGYPRCRETSAVILGESGEVTFEVVEPEETIACAWSPYAIDVWAVPLEATGGEVPELVTAG